MTNGRKEGVIIVALTILVAGAFCVLALRARPAAEHRR